VLFFEPKGRYYEKAELDTSVAPPPLYTSKVLRHGTRATLASYGPSIRTCLAAANAAAEADGVDLEVIDLRSLSPLDLGPVFESVRRTGRLVVVSEAPGEASLASEVVSRVQQECFYSLEAPVLRVTGFDTPYPPTKLEDEFLPDLDRVLHAVDRSLAW
jgi:pyruvate dehydrogenase E1 component beta subunit